MRFVLAMIGGILITLAMVVIGLSFFDDPPNRASLRQGVEVTRVPPQQRVDVADWLRETRADLPEEGEPVPRLPPPPPAVFTRDDVQGFVQLRFTVQPDGRATDVRVFGAVPPGYYERQAIEEVSSRRWEPGVDDAGQPTSRAANEIIHFTVPADAPRRVGDG